MCQSGNLMISIQRRRQIHFPRDNFFFFPLLVTDLAYNSSRSSRGSGWFASPPELPWLAWPCFTPQSALSHPHHSNNSIMPRVPSTLPFWFHLLIELPASINFFFHPSEQLSAPAPQAHAIIKQYAVLLFVSGLVALIFALRSVDAASRNVAGALSVYHLAPLVRAGSRIMEGNWAYGKGLGGPIFHLMVHTVCCVGLLGIFLARPSVNERTKAK